MEQGEVNGSLAGGKVHWEKVGTPLLAALFVFFCLLLVLSLHKSAFQGVMEKETQSEIRE